MQPRKRPQQHLELPPCHRGCRGSQEGPESVPSKLLSDVPVAWDRGAEGTGVLPLGGQLDGSKHHLSGFLNGTKL